VSHVSIQEGVDADEEQPESGTESEGDGPLQLFVIGYTDVRHDAVEA
jgi:hypothetical protein